MLGSLLSTFFRTAVALPPPLPNPETGEHHWFHGTGHEFEDHEDHEDRDPEAWHDQGGRLRSDPYTDYEYGSHSDKHWNVGLGVHFTSEHQTARGFASSHYGQPHHDSRVAHCRLHIANPKEYASEHDMTHEAIQWGHENGFHYLPKHVRESPETEERIERGESLSEIGGEDDFDPRLTYVDHEGSDAHEALDLDRGLSHDTGVTKSGNQYLGHSLDRYLSQHPEREEIVHGFKRHLEEQGHDGVTYGNEYESPIGHTCAIAFDDDRIHMDRWEWLHSRHPMHGRMPPGQHEQVPGQQELVKRHNDRGEIGSHQYGWHWRDYRDQKVGMLTQFLAEQLYRQPRPEFQAAPEHLSDEERNAHHEQQWTHDRRWKREVRRALSRGDLSPEEAKAQGYHSVGHDHSYTTEHGLGWEPLPHTLYHVTTNKAGVLSDNTLKSRKELNQFGGNGLGGGEDDTISFTDDPDVAKHIHRALHEYHQVLTGKIGVHDMLKEAREQGFEHHVVGGNYGGGNDWKSGDPYPQGLSEGLRGRRVLNSVVFSTPEEVRKKHPGAEPVPGCDHFDTPKGRIYTRYSTPMSEDEQMEWRSSHYKYHAAMREHFGDGRMDPGFMMNDPKGLASQHPSQFSIIRCHPQPGAQGYRVGALNEWRTVDGSAVHIGGVEESSPSHRLPHHGDGKVESINKQGSKDEPRYMYHATHPRHRESIAEHGLLTKYDQGEYNAEGDAGQIFLSPHISPHDTGTQDIWRVDVAGLPLEHDPYGDEGGGEMSTHVDIEPHRLTLHRAAPTPWRKQGKSSGGYLENPYHDGQFAKEWFHGTSRDFEGDPAPGMFEYDRPTKGMGGPQTNKLLGVHFTPLHRVAHGFAGTVQPSRIYHARLKMTSPVHFEDEKHLLQHVWRWADANHPGFHDKADNSNYQFNYGTTTHRVSEEDERMTRHHRNWKFHVQGNMETLLQFHPEQHDIAQGYIQHLRDRGHDGITYGNEVEGPRYHHCAIAFDPHQIEVTHVDRLSPYQGWKIPEPAPLPGHHTHKHIGAIHDEPDEMLREIERYHNAGKAKDEGHWWRNDRGNTGRGDFPFHQGAKQGIALRRFYHVAPEHVRKSIERHGLDFTKGDSPWHGIDFPQGNYLFADIDEAQRHQRFMDRQELDEYGPEEARKHDLYELTHPGLGIEKDPLWGPHVQSSWYANEPVPPEHIQRIGMGQRDEQYPPTLTKAELEHRYGVDVPGGPTQEFKDSDRFHFEWVPTHTVSHWGEMGLGDDETGHGGKRDSYYRGLADRMKGPDAPPIVLHEHDSGLRNLLDGYHRITIANEDGIEHLPAYVHYRHGHPDGRDLESTAALLPGYTHEHEWLPSERIFGPGKGTLDPRLFNDLDKMHEHVREVIFARLEQVWAPQYPDWQHWSRVYLAGSEASEWWGNNDFDTLIGIHYQRARRAHTDLAHMDDEQISAHLTTMLRQRFNDEDWVAPWDGQVWHLTGYVNKDSYDIAKIKPYAAYDMTNSRWAVKPPHLDKDWGPGQWAEGVWEQMESYVHLVKAIESLPEPDRTRQGAALFDFLHNDRKRAFGPEGYGWRDPGNAIWKALDMHPQKPLEKLVSHKRRMANGEHLQEAA